MDPEINTPETPSGTIPEEEITSDVQTLVKRVTRFVKKLPGKWVADPETLLELARMNRSQRRAAMSRLRRLHTVRGGVR